MATTAKNAIIKSKIENVVYASSLTSNDLWVQIVE